MTEINEHVIKCCLCNKTKDLQMIAHRMGDKVCGYLFVCKSDFPRVKDGEVEIREKE